MLKIVPASHARTQDIFNFIDTRLIKQLSNLIQHEFITSLKLSRDATTRIHFHKIMNCITRIDYSIIDSKSPVPERECLQTYLVWIQTFNQN